MFKEKLKTTPRLPKRGKSNHVLAVILKTLGKRQKNDCRAVFGYSRWTIKSIISGKLKFSHRAAKRISERTNVGIEWLLAGNGNVPPVTKDNKPFTQESYNKYQIKRQQKVLTVRRPTAAGLFPFLIIRAARYMAAAAAAGKSIEAFWKLREAIDSFGADFPNFAKPGQDFEMSLVFRITGRKVRINDLHFWKAIFAHLEQAEM
jgi:hypothetical protein